VKYGEKVAVFAVEDSTAIDDLLGFVVENFDLSNPIMEYIDDEGDRIRIADNHDLKNLFHSQAREIIVTEKKDTNTNTRQNPPVNMANLFQQMMPMAQQLFSNVSQQNRQPNNQNMGNQLNNFLEQMMPRGQQMFFQNNRQVGDEEETISPPSPDSESPDISPPSHSPNTSPVSERKKEEIVPAKINLLLKNNLGFPSLTGEKLSCCFISHATIEEGQKIEAGWKFMKTWNVKNNGLESWPEGVSLEFVNGKDLHITKPKVPILAPGEEGKISVAMQAPTESGRYIGYYQLKKDDNFGMRLWYHIAV